MIGITRKAEIRKMIAKGMMLGGLAVALFGACAGSAQVQYQGPPPPYPQPERYQGPEIYLGHAHVDGLNDHDDIKVGRYAGRYHSINLRVSYAPIQFDRVVIHYGDGASEVLPVRADIGVGGSSHWIQLPGGERVIRSLELWYSRASPGDPVKPEVQLYGRP
jgi:hypothetical protein